MVGFDHPPHPARLNIKIVAKFAGNGSSQQINPIGILNEPSNCIVSMFRKTIAFLTSPPP